MIAHNATHNEVIEGIFRNAHAPARQCHISDRACNIKSGFHLVRFVLTKIY